MPGTRQLLRRGKPGGTGPDDRHFLAGLHPGRLGNDPPHLPALIGNGMFNGFDPDGLIVDIQRTGFFARRRTDTPGELRKVVGRMQDFQCLLPISPVNQIVPVRNDVIDRATVVAEGDSAIHATRPLHARLFIVECCDELAIVLEARLCRLIRFRQTLTFQKSSRLSHFYATSNCFCAAISVSARRYSCGMTLTKRAR